ncbi:MAG TPA: glycosyltransferase [Puia sp.]|nr:glycosyltransferase [Puia sp.]
MKILLVGSDQVWSLEKIYIKYLLQEGVSVELFAAQNLFYEYNSRSIANKLKIRAGFSGIYRDINEQLRTRIEQFQPDIVWVFKGMEVMPETLKWMSAKGIRTVNYNPDNPFIFSGRGSGNRFVTGSISLYDLHFTYNLAVKKRLEEQLNLQTAFLPFGFELAGDVFQSAIREEEVLRACFLGNPDIQRAALVKELVNSGIPMDLYGNEWGKFLNDNPLLRIYPAVYGDDFWKTLRRYRVQLNLMRVHNEDSHNMRSFEVPGIGGIMLAPATTEHKLFFKDGEEAFLFSGVGECAGKAKYILGLNKEESDKIRDRAHRRCIEDGYTYEQRVKNALGTLKSLYAQAGDPSF